MTRVKSIKVRLTDEEFEQLQAFSKSKGLSLSEIIRDYIKSLKAPLGATHSSQD